MYWVLRAQSKALWTIYPIGIYVVQGRRFWKSGSDADKEAAYSTLYQALVMLSKLLAPSMPFIADEMYRNLVVNLDPQAPKSVHLADWPEFDAELLNDELVADMNLVMKLVSLGHAARNKSQIKVRQPLQEAASLGQQYS